ncbi:MAG: hypothetical protein V9G12_10275 [Microthrixaceae bacterium]
MPEPPTIAATPVGATVSIEGNSYGNLTVAFDHTRTRCRDFGERRRG